MSGSSQFPVPYQEQQRAEHSAELAFAAKNTLVALQPTLEPIWQEDEDLEVQQYEVAGTHQRPSLASGAETDRILHGLRVTLPDRLIAKPSTTGDAPDGLVPVPGCDYVGFQIPPTFQAPDKWVMRRLGIDVMLEAAGDITPISVLLKPSSAVVTEKRQIGELAVDLGQLASPFLGGMSIFTAKLGRTVATTSISPKIQASGLLNHHCSWRVSEVEICYNFSPAMIVQHARATRLVVSVLLRVEVHKRFFGVFRKAYFKSAHPRFYAYTPGDPLMVEVPEWSSDQPNGVGYSLKRIDRINKEYEGRPEEERIRALATAGHGQSMRRLAESLMESDRAQAERWYREAAHAGDATSMFELAALLRPTAPDDAKYWFQAAGESGYPRGWHALGRMTESSDRKEAARYYWLAMDSGDHTARESLRHLHKMSWWLRPRLLRD
jgi:hypothetical protein